MKTAHYTQSKIATFAPKGLSRLRSHGFFSILLIWLVLIACLQAQTNRIAEGELVNRTNPSISPGKADLEVLELSNGMSIIKTATADAAGKFRIEGLPNSQQLMIRATYKGANYHSMLRFNAEGRAKVQLEVYDTTASMNNIRVESAQMAFQIAGDQLQAIETYSIINETKPPVVYVHPEGTFKISKAPGILEPPQIRVTAPGTEMPLVQSAFESADGKSYYSLYPIRPGKTVFEVRQIFPYSSRTFVYEKKFYQDSGRLMIGVIPQDMTLTGEGLTKAQVDASQNFAVYASAPIQAGKELKWTFSGGTPMQSAPPAPAAESEGAKDAITAHPGSVGRNALTIAPLLLLGFVLVLWYACNRMPGGSQKVPESDLREIQARRESLLKSLAEADHQFERGTLDRRQHQKQREDLKQELFRIMRFLKNK
jgi:hypothetical protein